MLREGSVELAHLEEVDEEFEVVAFEDFGEGSVVAEALDPGAGEGSV